MKAIVIGATGATGKELVTQLLKNQDFNTVTVFVRRPYFGQGPKLKEVIVDFEKLNRYQEQIDGDVVFSCLGTTLRDAGSKNAQWRVDHDYQLGFARIARARGIKSFILLSAAGANVNSLFFYSKMKGALENELRKLNFPQLVILQPGGIERPGSTRAGEKAMIKLLKILNATGLLKKYAPISTKGLAKAMLASFFAFKEKDKTVSLKEIKALSA